MNHLMPTGPNPNHSIFHDYVGMQKIAANLNLSFSTKSVLKSQINSLATKHKITVYNERSLYYYVSTHNLLHDRT